MSTFTIGTATLEARAGQIILVPASVPHKFKNIGTDRLDVICIHASPKMVQVELEE